MKCLFPGSFDPFTKGHEHLVKRALRLFDEVIIAIGSSPKKTLCPHNKRVELIQTLYHHEPRVSVIYFNDLLVDAVRRSGAKIILRGLRHAQDFQYELPMTLMNRALSSDVDTLFLITDQEFMHISSSLLREILSAGGEIDDFVSEEIASYYRNVTAP